MPRRMGALGFFTPKAHPTQHPAPHLKLMAAVGDLNSLLRWPPEAHPKQSGKLMASESSLVAGGGGDDDGVRW